ncbi:hypothetical protein ABK040_001283 [Willaertia magna]
MQQPTNLSYPIYTTPSMNDSFNQQTQQSSSSSLSGSNSGSNANTTTPRKRRGNKQGGLLNNSNNFGSSNRSQHQKLIQLIEFTKLENNKEKLNHYLNQIEELLLINNLNNNNLVNEFLPNLLQLQHSNSSHQIEIKYFLSNFIEKCINFISNISIENIKSCAETLTILLVSSHNINIMKRIVISSISLFRKSIELIAMNDKLNKHVNILFSHISLLKKRILTYIDFENDGIQTHTIHFIEHLILIYSLNSLQNNLQSLDEMTYLQIQSNTYQVKNITNYPMDLNFILKCQQMTVESNQKVILNVDEMKREGEQYLSLLIAKCSKSDISPTVMSIIIQSLLNIAKHRLNFWPKIIPFLSEQVIRLIENNYNFTNYQKYSLKSLIKNSLLFLLRMPETRHKFRNVICNGLDRLDIKQDQIQMIIKFVDRFVKTSSSVLQKRKQEDTSSSINNNTTSSNNNNNTSISGGVNSSSGGINGGINNSSGMESNTKKMKIEENLPITSILNLSYLPKPLTNVELADTVIENCYKLELNHPTLPPPSTTKLTNSNQLVNIILGTLSNFYFKKNVNQHLMNTYTSEQQQQYMSSVQSFLSEPIPTFNTGVLTVHSLIQQQQQLMDQNNTFISPYSQSALRQSPYQQSPYSVGFQQQPTTTPVFQDPRLRLMQQQQNEMMMGQQGNNNSMMMMGQDGLSSNNNQMNNNMNATSGILMQQRDPRGLSTYQSTNYIPDKSNAYDSSASSSTQKKDTSKKLRENIVTSNIIDKTVDKSTDKSTTTTTTSDVNRTSTIATIRAKENLTKQFKLKLKISNEEQSEKLKKYNWNHLMNIEQSIRREGKDHYRIKLLCMMVVKSDKTDEKYKELLEYIKQDTKGRFSLLMIWLYMEYKNCILQNNYDRYNDLFNEILFNLDKSEYTFTKFIVESPYLTEDTIKYICKEMCENINYTSYGLITLKEIILSKNRPKLMEECLNYLLKYSINENDKIRNISIQILKQDEMYQEFKDKIVTFAREQAIHYHHTDTTTQQLEEDNKEEDIIMKDEENKEDKENKQFKQYATLYIQLAIEHSEDLFENLINDLYHQINILENDILSMITNIPRNTMIQFLQHFKEECLPLILKIIPFLYMDESLSKVLIYNFYERKIKNSNFVIPIILQLTKEQVLEALPIIIQNNETDISQKCINDLLLANPKGERNDKVSPDEILVALHRIEANMNIDKDLMIKIRMLIDLCFSQLHQKIFTKPILKTALQQLADMQPQLSRLLMRTVIQTLNIYPDLSTFIIKFIYKTLIKRKAYENKNICIGMMKCLSEKLNIFPISKVNELLEELSNENESILLEEVLKKYLNLREAFLEYLRIQQQQDKANHFVQLINQQ